MSDTELKSNDYWRDRLSVDEYRICRLKGTEMPGSGELYHEQREGVYVCACCGEVLFTSDSKYHSGSGWPSFFAPCDRGVITETTDGSGGMTRVEITCTTCDCHLGHVFPDGPKPTGLRYCVNSVSLRFRAE